MKIPTIKLPKNIDTTKILIILAVAVALYIAYKLYIIRNTYETNEIDMPSTDHNTNHPYMGGDTPPSQDNFTIEEFRCKDGTPVPKEYWGNLQMLMDNLQYIRDKVGVPIKINSGYRTKAYNTSIKGAKNSAHLTAKAADITIQGMTAKQVQQLIRQMIANNEIRNGGLGSYPTFTHYDVSTPRRWNG